MNEKAQSKRALVLRNRLGELSWVEIGSKDKESQIVAAREKQGYTVEDTTTVERARQLVNPPTPPADDLFQFRR